MNVRAVVKELRSLSNPKNIEEMARVGIKSTGLLGVSAPVIRKLAKKIGKDHRLAQELWSTGIHEARILAAFVDVPAEVTPAQMERWVAGS